MRKILSAFLIVMPSLLTNCQGVKSSPAPKDVKAAESSESAAFARIASAGNVVFPNYSTKEATGQEGHGGGGYVCRNEQGQITSVELVDTWEAKIFYKWTLISSNAPVADQVESALNKLLLTAAPEAKVTMEAALRKTLAKVMNDVIEVNQQVAIPAPEDVNPNLTKRGCTLEGIMKYDDARRVVYKDPMLFGALSPTDQAALYMHEAIYKMLRDNSYARDSVRARKITGFLFSDRVATPVAADLPESDVELCQDRDTLFYKFPHEGQFRFQFVEFGGEPLFSKSYFDVKLDAPYDSGLNLIKVHNDVLTPGTALYDPNFLFYSEKLLENDMGESHSVAVMNGLTSNSEGSLDTSKYWWASFVGFRDPYADGKVPESDKPTLWKSTDSSVSKIFCARIR